MTASSSSLTAAILLSASLLSTAPVTAFSPALFTVSYSNANSNRRVHTPTAQTTRLTTVRLSASASSLLQLDDDNMIQSLFRPSEDKPSAVLVDAYAPWCGPCKLIEPFLEKCAERHSDELNVLKYDVEGENNKQLKVEMLLQGVMVRGLPTLLLYNEGKPLATHSGAITEEELEGWLEEHLFSQVDSAISGDSGARTKSTQPKMDITNNDDGCEKRGLVSFASQFGRDDYML